MQDPKQEPQGSEASQGSIPFSTKGILVDLMLAALAFLFFCVCVIPSHNPVETPVLRPLLTAYTSGILTGLIWLILTLFRITNAGFKRAGSSSEIIYEDA